MTQNPFQTPDNNRGNNLSSSTHHYSSPGFGSQTAPSTNTPANVAAAPVAPAAEAIAAAPPAAKPTPQPNSKLANELNKFNNVAAALRTGLVPATDFEARCKQAFDIANDLFGNAPTWVCFYRELMGGRGMIHSLFTTEEDFGLFLRSEQYHQIQLMLTALRSRDQPENDPNDPQRMITVRLPKSLHEAMCEEAGRLNISVNRLCISRMLQLLDPQMIPKTTSKPRGRKPRTTTKQATQAAQSAQTTPGPQG